MKKLAIIALTALCAAVACNKFDDSAIWEKLNDHENRIVYLEEVCRKMNADIVNLQTLVTALESNDNIVSVSPLATGDGYTFTFSSGKSIVIYSGVNGQDGTDGKDGVDGKDGIDGKDGVTPVISVMKDTDGVYYWTVNGEWLLVNGNKLKASAEDGEDGTDGITPQFKIEDDYWYVSYDNGTSWEQLGKASQDTVSVIVGISFDDNYVYFTLSSGEVLTLSRIDADSSDNATNPVESDGSLTGEFSVSSTSKVRFSKGNLQYQASSSTWRFAEDQLTLIGQSNDNASETFYGWIDLFAYGANGYNGADPWLYENFGMTTDINGTDNDWGVNPITNGGNTPKEWRTLTKAEWQYIMEERDNALSRYGAAIVNSIKGIVFLPDVWICPSGLSFLIDHSDNRDFADNTYSIIDWKSMEEAGAVFLPIGGHIKDGEYVNYGPTNIYGGYWTSTIDSGSTAYVLYTYSGKTAGGWFKPSVGMTSYNCSLGYNVRLVKDI